MKEKIKVYFRKAYQKIIALFKQGLSPLLLAQSVIVSVLITVIPMFGITTITLTAISLRTKLNLPIMIAVSYVATPLQLLLFMPLIEIGEFIFAAEHTLYTLGAIRESFHESFFGTIGKLSFEILCGFVGWLLTAVPAAFILYYFFRLILFIFRKIKPLPKNEHH